MSVSATAPCGKKKAFFLQWTFETTRADIKGQGEPQTLGVVAIALVHSDSNELLIAEAGEGGLIKQLRCQNEPNNTSF